MFDDFFFFWSKLELHFEKKMKIVSVFFPLYNSKNYNTNG